MIATLHEWLALLLTIRRSSALPHYRFETKTHQKKPVFRQATFGKKFVLGFDHVRRAAGIDLLMAPSSNVCCAFIAIPAATALLGVHGGSSTFSRVK